MTIAEKQVSNFNIANVLTVVRIVLVPVLAWALLHDGGDSMMWRWIAFGIFVAAMITDKIDGDLARKHNLITDFGKIADPIADKAITGMALIGLSVIGELWWWVTAVVLIREWGITFLRIWVIRHGVMAAGAGGKLKTVMQTIALCGLILPLRDFDGALGVIGGYLWWVAAVVMGIAVAITVVTGIDYVLKALAVRREGRAKERVS